MSSIFHGGKNILKENNRSTKIKKQICENIPGWGVHTAEVVKIRLPVGMDAAYLRGHESVPL